MSRQCLRQLRCQSRFIRQLLRRLKFLGLSLLVWVCIALGALPGPEVAHSTIPANLLRSTTRPPIAAWRFPTNDVTLTALELAEATSTSEVTSLVQQGMALYQAERYQDAIDRWQQAVQQYQAQDDRLGQVMVFNQMAQAYQALHQWSAAQQVLSRSSALLALTSQTPRSTLLEAQFWNIQGFSQFHQGHPEQAVASWQRAIDLYTLAHQETGRLGSLINLAQAQQSLGFSIQAQTTLLTVYQALDQQPDSRLKIMGLLHLGNILRLTGGLTQAQVRSTQGTALNSQQILQQALAIAQRLQTPDLLATVYLSLGNTAWTEQRFEAAIVAYQQAQQPGADPLTRLQAGLNQLALLIDQQQWDRVRPLIPSLQTQTQQLPISHTSLYARLHLTQSLTKLLPTRTIAPQTLMQLLDTTIAAARNLQDSRAESYALGYQGKVYAELQQWEQAQSVTERALLISQNLATPDITYQWEWQLGRILRQQNQLKLAEVAFEHAYDHLTSLRQDLLSINPDIQFNFREQVEPVYREYIDLLLPTGNFSSHQPVTNQQLIQARKVLESFRLAELSNFLGANCLQPIALDQVAQAHDAAVIYPIILPNRLAVIVSLSDEMLSYTTEISASSVAEMVNQLRLEWEKPYTSPRGKQLAQRLDRLLIQPLEQELAKHRIKTLVFVLDGVLRNVPMAALYDGQQYLIERYAVALAPGLTLLTPSALKTNRFNALLVGLTEARQGFAELANVDPEIKAIQALLPSQVLLNERFTKKNLQTFMQNSPAIVHLATHGQFGSTMDQTFILTWDGRMNVNELRHLLQTTHPTIDLLVLSACETAAGDERAALGLAGVAVQSGTRRTLASLWSVDDQSGALFTRHFYKALVQEAGSSADALRQAQRLLLKDPTYRHPRYWAPYVLLGSWL